MAYFEVVLRLKQTGQALTKQSMVIHDQNPDFRSCWHRLILVEPPPAQAQPRMRPHGPAARNANRPSMCAGSRGRHTNQDRWQPRWIETVEKACPARLRRGPYLRIEPRR